MKKRTITGAILLAIFIPLLVVKELFVLFQILMLGLSIMASVEMINMYEKRHEFPIGVKIAIVISTIMLYLSFLTSYNVESAAGNVLKLFNIRIEFIPTLMIIVIVFLALMVACSDFNGAAIGRAFTIILYCSFGFGTITVLRSWGLEFVLYLFCITVFTDVFAYLFGMAFGKHKMAPNISPKKSWEGAIGGTAVATIVGVCFALFYNKIANNDGFTIFSNLSYMNFDWLNKPMQIIFIVFLTICSSILGQIGDLVASKFKRTYEIKDFSNIFPGHGGVLDRLDSAIFVSMFLCTVIVLFNNFLL
ncbi:MAG: phosphatidate cytidylyltransferase [Anaeroplasmataceae bacterium]